MRKSKVVSGWSKCSTPGCKSWAKPTYALCGKCLKSNATFDIRGITKKRQEELNKMSYILYLRTPEWRKLRQNAIEIAENRCQICNSKRELAAHHRVYNCLRGHERIKDITILCKKCHSLFHKKKIVKKRKETRITNDLLAEEKQELDLAKNRWKNQ